MILHCLCGLGQLGARAGLNPCRAFCVDWSLGAGACLSVPGAGSEVAGYGTCGSSGFVLACWWAGKPPTLIG